MTISTFSGTLDDIDNHFYDNGWTDGLPIVPPTRDRVAAFLDHSHLAEDVSLGIAQPANNIATVHSVAVNGVLAGCRPEYMPLLLAVVSAIVDDEFRLQDAGSTPGWEPMIIVNGPVVEEIDLNCAGGVLRTGHRANATIGRFVRLYMRNVAGLRIPPGSTDKATLGQNFNVALAENEAAAGEVGWPTFAVERGFAPGDSVVTVQSAVAASMPTYSAGATWQEHASLLAEVIGQGMWSYWACTGFWFGRFHPLLVLSPSIARAIGGTGCDKDRLRAYFAETVTLPARTFERYAWAIGITDFSIDRLVAEGRLPADYGVSTDPDRSLRALLNDGRDIGIVVSGDRGRNQSKGYVQNHVQGPPVSRRLGDLPVPAAG